MTRRADEGDNLPRVLGTAPWVYAALGGADLLFTLGAVGFYLHQGLGPFFVVSVLLATLAVLAMAEAVVTRIILGADTLEIQSLRRRGRYRASEIHSVRWEGGSGVSLLLATGRWVKLPDLGRNAQSVSNAVRGWLKRATESGGE